MDVHLLCRTFRKAWIVPNSALTSTTQSFKQNFFFAATLGEGDKIKMSWIEDPGVDTWRGLRLYDLGIDEAYINITSTVSEAIWLYTLSDDCENCPFQKHSRINTGETILKMSTKRNLKFRILNSDTDDLVEVSNVSSRVCDDVTPALGEFGVYDFILEPTTQNNISCNLVTSKECVNIYLPLVALLLGLLIVAVVSTCLTYLTKRLILYCKKRKTSNKVNCELSDYGADDKTTQASAKPAKLRIRSIDTFRGISVVFMIFVNDGAGHYWFLEHATWDGILAGDFVFPWFLWIMGVCIPLSIRSQLKRGVSRWKILANIIKRGLILFGLGLMLNAVGKGPDLETLRIPGVLQRFSIVYLIIATLGVCFTPRTIATENRFPSSGFKEIFQDIIFICPQWIVVLSIVAAYCYFAFFSPVPGCPMGYIGPGGIQDNERFRGCTGGMTGYVDKMLLGDKHLYPHSTVSEVYRTEAFDPEGLLGVMPSILQGFLGVQAGIIILHFSDVKGKIIRWLTWGIICAILALVLALPNIIPINKNLWSLSFVFTTTSSAFFLLSLIFFLQDYLRLWNGVPFKAPGMNPIILYVGHIVAYNVFPFHWSYGKMNTHFIVLIESLWGTSLWIIIAYWLYYIEFYLSV